MVTDVRRPRRVVHLVGSPVDAFHADLSRMYAGAAIAALTDTDRYDFHIAHVGPGGRWSFPADLSPEAVQSAETIRQSQALARLRHLDVDLAVPHMFCLPGMTTYRSILRALGISYIGNSPHVMALAADKVRARNAVSAAGVRVPDARIVCDETPPDIRLPVVVKPVLADNSVGVSLVREPDEYAGAVRSALACGGRALVESYVELGREVRCGIIVRDGELVCLPLEEYAVNAATKPIRDRDDKLARASDGALFLVAKDSSHAGIVPELDPINASVWDIARRCHRALGCRHYSLFDFRIDPQGSPWFLEAGLYCSFAPSSVIAVMAQAAGIAVDALFAGAVAELGAEASSCA